jgi:hypothetical protein
MRAGVVANVLNSGKLSEEESKKLIEMNQNKLQLTSQQIARWAGKRYLVLIEVRDVVKVVPFPIDKSGFSNMDDGCLWKILIGSKNDEKNNPIS